MTDWKIPQKGEQLWILHSLQVWLGRTADATEAIRQGRESHHSGSGGGESQSYQPKYHAEPGKTAEPPCQSKISMKLLVEFW